MQKTKQFEVVKSKGNQSLAPSPAPVSDKQTIKDLIAEVARLTGLMQDAENCLVCSAIGDPREVCLTTLDILRARKKSDNLDAR